MSRRTTIALIMLLLLLLSLVVLAVTRPPFINIEKTSPPPEPTGKLPSERFRDSPVDDGKPPLPEGEEGSLTEEPKAIIRVINHTGWLNEGIYEVIGEVENTGALIARGVSFHVIFKDGLFKTLVEVDEPADRTTIGPGDKSTFKIKLNDKNKSDIVGSYVIVPQIER